ncbi:MAG: class I SAM-dependent methyltransferase [Rhodospirillales bacterium]|nr:class I SAM-dependent methyltransferase [Rhodospirillales bacterium]MBO6785890.1 class I SAM-dependent methyltransferase [Rhodospirillales bacterium]
MLFARLLEHVVNTGRLTVIDAGGKEHVFAGTTGSSLTIRLHDKSLHWKLFINPELYLGEAYMNGTLTVEDGDIYDFLQFAMANIEEAGSHPVMDWMARADSLFRRFQQHNPVSRARKNVAHHYDLSGDLYDLFLDRDRQYSCAYFTSPDVDLDTAQLDKKRHIAAKLLLKPDMEVLDIGCGWGGLALYLAEATGVRVTGLTLSEEQLAVARERARRRGMEDRVSFHLRDYRQQTGVFDRIVSVGMFEHVGVTHFQQYFSAVRDLMKDDGVALIHTIGRTGVPRATNQWIRKYIFPGGYIPALSEMMESIERTGLVSSDIEVLRLHYADTLKHWRARFQSNRDKAADLYDERFCRMWEFYLAASEVSFRHMDNVVYQVQLANRRDTVPLTRDYITDWEERLRREDKDVSGDGAAA